MTAWVEVHDAVAPLLVAGSKAIGEYRCESCGYGVTVFRELPRCPMCGARDAWARSGSGDR